MPDIVEPPKVLEHIPVSTLCKKYLPTFFYKCVHVTTMNYKHISGFILQQVGDKFKFSSGLMLKVDEVRYIACRELSLFFVIDHEETMTWESDVWRDLPVELVALCMTFARDVTDLLLWRTVSKGLSTALSSAVGDIEHLDMRHLGGRCWDIKGTRDTQPIATPVLFYSGHNIRHISLPREYYVNAIELRAILHHPNNLKVLTIWYPSLFLRRIFKGGGTWSDSVETVRLIGIGINRSALNSTILRSMKEHLPNLQTIHIDYSNFFSSNPADLMRIAETYNISLEFGPYFDALGNVDSVDKMEYAIEELNIDPSLHFHETFQLRQTRATNLMDLAVVKSQYPQREDIIRFLAKRGASIRDCVNRYAWWSVIASGDCERDLQLFSEIARSQTKRLMSPVMLESISKLKDIRDIGELEVARLFLDRLPSDIFSEPENLFRIVQFDSPHYHDFILRIMKHYTHPKVLECCNNDRETVLTLAIRNQHLTDQDLMLFITPSLPYKNSLFGSEKMSYLHLAVKHNRPLFVDALCNGHEVKLDTYNKDGDTPMHIAARYKHFHIIDLLLFHGASRTVRSLADKRTPWEIALSHEDVHKPFIPVELEPRQPLRRVKRRRSPDLLGDEFDMRKKNTTPLTRETGHRRPRKRRRKYTLPVEGAVKRDDQYDMDDEDEDDYEGEGLCG